MEPLAVELMNTVFADREGVHDALATDTGARAWLEGMGQSPVADFAALRELRDALRGLAAARTADPRPVAGVGDLAGAVGVVNVAAAGAPGWPVLHWVEGEEPFATTAFSGDDVVARFAREGIELFASGAQVRACLAPGCVLYFVKEHTRREWCSAGCGNRARVARHYEKQKRS